MARRADLLLVAHKVGAHKNQAAEEPTYYSALLLLYYITLTCFIVTHIGVHTCSTFIERGSHIMQVEFIACCFY